ncbi:3-isopropylmalate dehydrogenase [Lactiplantibacillus pentosus]|uniref:3-isopropylmalate dehydrogenase n=1 Tax=Lactiplantibacillus pentosus TaxID=1589 RepID=UPI0021A7258F|nr:3-isopropylmalate dehydrogenase [Lactiplantibacillus pentosus]MCT3064609.1 3-isopropylmalate dehydrogenase [Lactiplantibacillus pentosus]
MTTTSVAQIAVLAGDGVGPEIMTAALAVLKTVSQDQFQYQLQAVPFGGIAIDQCDEPLPATTLATCQASDAVLLAAVGGPKWDQAPQRPEAGLLALRQALNLFANIRPTRITEANQHYSPLKLAAPVDFVIFRELTSGIYFGQPRTFSSEMAVDTMRYQREEIARIARLAFQFATTRSQHVTLVDKANVLASSRLWRQVVAAIAAEFPAVTYDTKYVDATAMQLIAHPEQFDVILTANLFGDILSDEAAEITGSLGTIPSISQGSQGPALYEPIHGSAPDIAGQSRANPIAMIRSVALMLAHSFKRTDLANEITTAIDAVMVAGIVTPDLGGSATTTAVTAAIINHIQESREVYATDHV